MEQRVTPIRRNLPDTGEHRAIRPVKLSPVMPQPLRPETVYVCQRCHDTGWLRYDAQFGHSQFGKVKRCPCSEVGLKNKARAQTFAWLGMDSEEVAELEAQVFDGFQARYPFMSQGKTVTVDLTVAYQKARTWAEQARFQQKGMANVLFPGDFGVGKTRLAAAILNELRVVGVPCLFAGAVEFFNALYAADFEEKQRIIDKAATTQVLCLDDLDKLHVKPVDSPDEEAGGYQKTVLFELLNRRYRAKLPTVITTNKVDDLGKWLHGSVLSRLFGADKVLAIAMIGPDYRMRRK